MREGLKVLVLSIGYGMGHHAAARAVVEELEHRGCQTLTVDPCEQACPAIFAATQRFYHFCVRRAPGVWGVTYAQTDNSDWAGMLWLPGLAPTLRKIRALVDEYRPDACVCTYPLFAHMLDAINTRRTRQIPYALVVTDALEISRPWATSKAPLICVPDPLSRRLLMERYGIAEDRIVSTGFPVRAAFRAPVSHTAPTADGLRILYGVFLPLRQVRRDVRALLTSYPRAHLVMVAGERWRSLQHLLAEFPGRLELIDKVRDMQPLFAAAHIYIGKSGAATTFEAYASRVPIIINYALPGQEQGNLELLLSDGAGLHAEGTDSLLHAVAKMLDSGAALWRQCSAAMLAAGRVSGAGNIADEMERRFL